MMIVIIYSSIILKLMAKMEYKIMQMLFSHILLKVDLVIFPIFIYYKRFTSALLAY
jgi:FtsH-binding integral membrane protein